MAENLKVERREDFGKGAARRIRRDNAIPAVLYGHEMDPVHLVLPYHATALIARNSNALIELELPDGKTKLALIKDIQRHPVRREIQHLDLIVVKRGEKVEVDIPFQVEGEPVSPATHIMELNDLTILVDALKVPEVIEISVEGLEEGTQIFAGDLTLPEGAELVTDAEALVVSVEVPQVDEADLETPEAEDAEGEEAAEGEESFEDAEDSDEE